MLLQYLQEDPRTYAMIVMTVMASIVLHELAHGFAAIMLGDDTPIRMGRMTGNPLVHMGWFSIIALCVVGMAWGQMPIDHSRLRGKYGEAIVAAAGPLSNLILAIAVLTGYGLWRRNGPLPETEFAQMMLGLLQLAGMLNIALCLFNLIPLPPLDGSHILANYHRGYAQLIGDPQHQGAFMFAFMIVFAVSPLLMEIAGRAADWYIHLFL